MTTISTPNDAKLPKLNEGITLLTAETESAGALQSLVLDHLLLTNGSAVWIDAKNNAATTALAKIAPSKRILNKIRVARAFTAFQHYSLLVDIDHALTSDTTLVVVPSTDWFYAHDDLYNNEGKEMLEHALKLLKNLSETYEIPVLLSREISTGLGAMLEDRCDNTLQYVPTEFGARFTGDDYETLVFECNGGIQTTLAFWRRVLETRHSAYQTKTSREVSHIGTY